MHLAIYLGVTPFEFHKDHSHRRTRVPKLMCGIPACISLAIMVEHHLVTDRWIQDRSILGYTAPC